MTSELQIIQSCQGHSRSGLSCQVRALCAASRRRSQNMSSIFSVQCIIKELLGSVFVTNPIIVYNHVYNKILDREWFSTHAPIFLVIGVLSRGCPISGIRFELLVISTIGYPRDFHVNHKRLNGFRQCFLQFSKLRKSASAVFRSKEFLKRHSEF